MTLDDFDTFSAVVVGFAELRGKTLSPEAIELYFRAMHSWSLADFKAAAELLLRTSQFMPTPFDFEELRKAGRPVPAEAWSTARAVAKTWRPNTATPSSGNALIDRAVESIGGYRAIAMHSIETMGFLEKRFIDAFESMRDADDTREAVPQIAANGSSLRLSGPRKLGEGLQRLLPNGAKP